MVDPIIIPGEKEMLQITARQKQILKLLLYYPNTLTIKTLARAAYVSERSLRYDLDYIDAYLKSQNLHLTRTPGKGISIATTDTKRKIILEGLEEVQQGYISDDEIKYYLLFQLLLSDRCTLAEFGRDFVVGYIPLRRSIESLNSLLQPFSLTIFSKKGSGTSIEGKELDKRRVFNNTIELLSSHISEFQVPVLDAKLKPYYKMAQDSIRLIESSCSYQFVEKELLTIQIGFAAYRSSRCIIDENDFDKSEVFASKEYRVLDKSGLFSKFNNAEKQYFTSLFLNAKIVPKLGTLSKSENEDDFAKQVTDFLVTELSKLADKRLLEDTHFISQLYLHLKVSISRIRHGRLVENPLTSQIKIEIPIIYEITNQILDRCAEEFSLEFKEPEIAYIAMHIAAAYENLPIDIWKPRVAVICNQGLATSSYLLSKLRQNFGFCEFIGCFSEKELLSLIQTHSPDILISTYEMKLTAQNLLVINPMLGVEDIEKIQSNIFSLLYTKNCKLLLDNYRENVRFEHIKLSDYMNKDEIQIIDQCENWEEAIRLAASPLVKETKINLNYVERMIEIVKSYGNYMILLPEVAFVHAGINDGINCTCSSLLVLKKPILFGNRTISKVQSIVVLGIKEKSSLLLNLVYVFENPLNRSALNSPDITKNLILKMQS